MDNGASSYRRFLDGDDEGIVEIIKDYNRMQEDNAQVRFEAVKDVQKALESGDRKFAQEMCEKYNQILEKMGLMKIEIPEEE